jgi:hypothetical protein
MGQFLDTDKTPPLVLITRTGRHLTQDQIREVAADARAKGLLKTALKHQLPTFMLFQAALRLDEELALRVSQIDIHYPPRPMPRKKPGPAKGTKMGPHDHRNKTLGPIMTAERTRAAAELAVQIGTTAAAQQFGISSATLRRSCKRYGVLLVSPIGYRAAQARRMLGAA